MKNTYCIIIMFVLVISCVKNNTQIKQDIIDDGNVTETAITVEQEKLDFWDNYDWLTEFDWWLEDGRHLIDPSVVQIDLIGDMAPFVNIYKFELSSDTELYQTRLRNEYFYFLFKTEDKDTLFPLDNTSFSSVLDFEFRDNYSILALYMANGYSFAIRDRVGLQLEPEYPLVGVWGKLPSLVEHRLLDPVGCLYYMEIKSRFPGFAIREGTYLLKQTGERQFETISSFPDGNLRLDFIDDYSILITPLFILPEDEEGIVGPLIMRCNPNYPRFIVSDGN